jgi:hypothetical protein
MVSTHESASRLFSETSALRADYRPFSNCLATNGVATSPKRELAPVRIDDRLVVDAVAQEDR